MPTGCSEYDVALCCMQQIDGALCSEVCII